MPRPQMMRQWSQDMATPVYLGCRLPVLLSNRLDRRVFHQVHPPTGEQSTGQRPQGQMNMLPSLVKPHASSKHIIYTYFCHDTCSS